MRRPLYCASAVSTRKKQEFCIKITVIITVLIYHNHQGKKLYFFYNNYGSAYIQCDLEIFKTIQYILNKVLNTLKEITEI